jgi:hypothetical protein
VSGVFSQAAPGISASPAPQTSILFDALRALPAGAWAELGCGAASASLCAEFGRAGWHVIRLDADGNPVASPASCTDMPAYLMAVHDSALERLAVWQPGVCRPLLVLTRPASPAPGSLSQPAWQASLARNGYLFAADDDDYAYFVRNDQPDLYATLAQLASKGWQVRLQASRHAHANEARAARQAHQAALQAQAQASAAQFEVQALQHQLAAVYASSSWKSTRPLRWGMRLARQPRSALREAAVLAARLLSKLMRPALSRALGNPRLRRRLASVERRHPALMRRVKSLLRPSPAAPLSYATAPAEPMAIHPGNTVGPQFKTLLLDEIDRSLPPTSR